MKKLLALLLSGLLLATMAGCGDSYIVLSGTGKGSLTTPDKWPLPSTTPDVTTTFDIEPLPPVTVPPVTMPTVGGIEEISIITEYSYRQGTATLYARPLVFAGGAYPSYELPDILPDGIGNPVAGDVYHVVFKEPIIPDSDMMVDESIVESVEVKQAEIVRVVYSNYGDGETFEIYHDNGDREIAKVASRPGYIVQGSWGTGKCYPLADVMYDQFYATYSPVDGYSEEDGYHFSAFYSACPRYEKRKPHPDTLAAVEELNKNAGFSLDLLAELENCDLTGFVGGKQFGCYCYEKFGQKYTFTPYPDHDNGGWYLTSVEGEKGKLAVFGLDGDESDEKIRSTMIGKGYKLLDWVDSYEAGYLTFLKNGVQITFAGKAKSRTISVELYVSNDLGYAY
jgi:hypothetical protein